MSRDKYPDLKNQKSVSKTFQVGEELSDDGMLWIQDALFQVSRREEGYDMHGNLVVSQKFRITITKIEETA